MPSGSLLRELHLAIRLNVTSVNRAEAQQMTAKIRALVVDDERPSRSFLVAALAAFAEVEIIAEAKSGREAVHLIETMRPDVAFLDIHMPDIDGFAVLQLLQDWKPLIVFVTAYEQYRSRARELNAVDYLLKPVDHCCLGRALDRVRERKKCADTASKMSA
jgi:DNA-binding LytR/AlgR family response regulator